MTDKYAYVVSIQQCHMPFQLYITKDTKYNNTTMIRKPDQRKTIDATLFTLEITHLKKEHEQRQ
jgi:hypothetical protein